MLPSWLARVIQNTQELPLNVFFKSLKPRLRSNFICQVQAYYKSISKAGSTNATPHPPPPPHPVPSPSPLNQYFTPRGWPIACGSLGQWNCALSRAGHSCPLEHCSKRLRYICCYDVLTRPTINTVLLCHMTLN